MRGFSLTLLGPVVLSFAACSVYDEALKICQSPACQGNNGARSGGAGNGDGGSGAGGEGGTGAGTAYCNAGTRATYPDPPTGVAPSTKNVEIVGAQYQIDLGDAEPNVSNPPKHFLEIGFDLDNKCTAVSDPKQFTCKAPSYALGVPDGLGGIDNALGGLIQVVRNQIGNFSSDNYSKSIQDGKSNVLLRMVDWNGEANDDQVTVSTLIAAPFDSFTAGAKPAWLGFDAWPIASDTVNGDVNHPKFVDINAYVTNYQLVATLAQANLRLDVGLTTTQFVKLDMKLSAAFVVCPIVPSEEGKWGYTFAKCTLGGRWSANDLVKQLGQFPDPLNNNKPLCAGTEQYTTFKKGICSQVDIFHTVGSPTQLCDALTLGITYSMRPALLGNVFKLKDIPDRCCTPPPLGTCVIDSPEDHAHNPRFDCCEGIGAPDGGALQACGVTPSGTGGTGNGGAGGGTGGRGTGGRASGGAGGATGGRANSGGTDAGTDAGGGGRDASPD